MARDGQITREKILAETQSLVLEHGFSGTTIDRILEKTGITKGAFFYHFKSKTELGQALLDDFSQRDLNDLYQALTYAKTQEKEPDKQLLAFVQCFIDSMKSLTAPYPGCLYAAYNYESAAFEPFIMDKIGDTLKIWRKEILQLFAAAAYRAERLRQQDQEALADMFVTLLEGSFIVAKSMKDASITYRQLQLYHDFLSTLLTSEDDD
jgi:TetR/AcrR family transcriptional repressor of nem operon